MPAPDKFDTCLWCGHQFHPLDKFAVRCIRGTIVFLHIRPGPTMDCFTRYIWATGPRSKYIH